MAIDDKKLEELKQKHGSVWLLKRGEFDIAFRKPTSMEYRKYSMDVSTDKSQFYDANEAICKACIVYPEGKAAETLLEEWPGLIPDVGQEVLAVAQLSAKAEGKKA